MSRGRVELNSSIFLIQFIFVVIRPYTVMFGLFKPCQHHSDLISIQRFHERKNKTEQMMKPTVCGESILMMWRKTCSTLSRCERHFRMLQDILSRHNSSSLLLHSLKKYPNTKECHQYSEVTRADNIQCLDSARRFVKVLSSLVLDFTAGVFSVFMKFSYDLSLQCI